MMIVRVSIAHFPRLAQNLMHTRFSFLWSISKIDTGHVHNSKNVWKLPTSTQLHATWHTDALDVVVLPSTGALRYHNCCIDGGTSSENFGYHLVRVVLKLHISKLGVSVYKYSYSSYYYSFLSVLKLECNSLECFFVHKTLKI